MEAPYDEDISTPHEKALGKISRAKRLSEGAKEREREGRERENKRDRDRVVEK